MSLRGLADEAKTYFRIDRTFLLFIGGILLLVASLFYVRNHFQGYSSAPVSLSPEQIQTQQQLQQLMELRSEVQNLKNELGEKRMAAANDTLSPVTPPVTSAGKESFVGFKPGDGFAQIKDALEDAYIPMGSVFRARLLMPIKTSVQESFVMAETTHEFRMDSIRRIPRHTRLIGTAQLNPMLRGVVVRFHTIVSPKGIEYPANVLALSTSLFPELEGIYFKNDLETYSAVLAFGFMQGFSDGYKQTEPSVWGPVAKSNVTNQVLSGVSSASFRITEEMINEVRNRRVEYVVIPAAESIYLVFDKRFVLKNNQPITD